MVASRLLVLAARFHDLEFSLTDVDIERANIARNRAEFLRQAQNLSAKLREIAAKLLAAAGNPPKRAANLAEAAVTALNPAAKVRQPAVKHALTKLHFSAPPKTNRQDNRTYPNTAWCEGKLGPWLSDWCAVLSTGSVKSWEETAPAIAGSRGMVRKLMKDTNTKSPRRWCLGDDL
jgi:hypothetical protein